MTALDLITAVEQTAAALADAQRTAAHRRIACAELESELAASLIGNPNPLTGRAHSASSAAEAASQHESVFAARRHTADAESVVTRLRGTYEAARLRAAYEVATADQVTYVQMEG